MSNDTFLPLKMAVSRWIESILTDFWACTKTEHATEKISDGVRLCTGRDGERKCTHLPWVTTSYYGVAPWAPPHHDLPKSKLLWLMDSLHSSLLHEDYTWQHSYHWLLGFLSKILGFYIPNPIYLYSTLQYKAFWGNCFWESAIKCNLTLKILQCSVSQ